MHTVIHDHQYDNPEEARKIYQSLLKDSINHRKYVHGSKHITMFDDSEIEIIDWNVLGDTDIKVRLRNQKVTYIKIIN